MKRTKPKRKRCCYCDKPAEGNYSIHRDGFGIGPELPLCNKCGCNEQPTCHDIWKKTSYLIN